MISEKIFEFKQEGICFENPSKLFSSDSRNLLKSTGRQIEAESLWNTINITDIQNNDNLRRNYLHIFV